MKLNCIKYYNGTINSKPRIEIIEMPWDDYESPEETNCTMSPWLYYNTEEKTETQAMEELCSNIIQTIDNGIKTMEERKEEVMKAFFIERVKQDKQ
jgi:hypothetical protein